MKKIPVKSNSTIDKIHVETTFVRRSHKVIDCVLPQPKTLYDVFQSSNNSFMSFAYGSALNRKKIPVTTPQDHGRYDFERDELAETEEMINE